MTHINSNWTLFPEKNEKKRFAIVLSTFAVVLMGAVIFGCYCLFLYLNNLYANNQLASNQQQQKEELDARIRQFGIKINKIGVLAPAVKEVDGTQKTIYDKELKKGVAHYKGTALPNQGSNVFIFGHSSSAIGTGKYAETFARLGELEKGDKIIIYYNYKEYQYDVFEKKVVEKTDISVLSPTEKEQLTLMTCWPIGTNLKRLIIKASPATIQNSNNNSLTYSF